MRIGRINKFGDEHFEQTKKEGLSFIEVCCNNREDSEKFIADVEAVKARIAAYGIDIPCVGRWYHTLMHDGKIDEAEAEVYFRLMDAAIEVGAKTFVCGCNYDESISLYQNYTHAITFFRRLLEHADGRIRVAVENCDWNNFVTSPEQWKIILGELPGLMIKFDASHAYKRHEDYLGQLSDWGRRVAHVHLKGVVLAGTGYVDDPPAGMDDLNWSAIFAILYSRGYNGDLSIEPHSAVWNGELGEFGVAFTKHFAEQFLR